MWWWWGKKRGKYVGDEKKLNRKMDLLTKMNNGAGRASKVANKVVVGNNRIGWVLATYNNY
jgi:hypothetical protein